MTHWAVCLRMVRRHWVWALACVGAVAVFAVATSARVRSVAAVAMYVCGRFVLRSDRL